MPPAEPAVQAAVAEPQHLPYLYPLVCSYVSPKRDADNCKRFGLQSL